MKRLVIALFAIVVVLGAIASVVVQGDAASACAIGLSPGYWKNHTADWPVEYSTEQTFFSAFGVGPSDLTLLEGLAPGGGKWDELERLAVASLLNSAAVPDALSLENVLIVVRHAYNYNDWQWGVDLLQPYID